MEQLTLIPEIINGVTRAYRFERIGHDAVMDALGIHVGDRLTAVNGIPVDLVPSISRYLANATRHGHIRLQIEDRHHSREIEFTLAAG